MKGIIISDLHVSNLIFLSFLLSFFFLNIRSDSYFFNNARLIMLIVKKELVLFYHKIEGLFDIISPTIERKNDSDSCKIEKIAAVDNYRSLCQTPLTFTYFPDMYIIHLQLRKVQLITFQSITQKMPQYFCRDTKHGSLD